MLSRLVHERGAYQLCRVELADGESIQPCLLPTREAVNLRASHIPQLDVDAVRPALTKKQHCHGRPV
jgi:hypothetical protein